MYKVVLKKIFEIETKQTFFSFGNKVYEQIGGVAMGLPLAPALANLLMCHHEKI